MSRSFLRLPLFVLLGCMFYGCDTLTDGSGDNILLSTTITEICFELDGISSGGTETIVAQEAIDIGAFLDQQNFTRADIESAEVSAVQLRMVFPLGGSLSSVRDVSFQLRSTSGNATTVATSDSFTDTRRASLDVNSASVGGIVSGSSFQAVLNLTGVEGISEAITIEAEMTLQVEVASI